MALTFAVAAMAALGRNVDLVAALTVVRAPSEAVR